MEEYFIKKEKEKFKGNKARYKNLLWDVKDITFDEERNGYVYYLENEENKIEFFEKVIEIDISKPFTLECSVNLSDLAKGKGNGGFIKSHKDTSSNVLRNFKHDE